MDPNIWGPGAWLFLHTITLNYPHEPTPTDKEDVREFFRLAGRLLPCFYCRENYAQHLKEYPIQVESKTDLVHWLIDIHNSANESLGKPVLSRQEAMEKILCMYRKQSQNPFAVHSLYFGLLFILIIAGLYIFSRRR
jgi:FAD-linked sulfhydryl oxidase